MKSLVDNETNYFPSKTLLIDTAKNDNIIKKIYFAKITQIVWKIDNLNFHF